MNEIKPFRISGTGCALVDYLYKPVDFSGTDFIRYLSESRGDGGLAPGKLVFTEEFEKFCGEKYTQIRDRITKNMDPVAINIGGPSIVSLIHAAQMLHCIFSPTTIYLHQALALGIGSGGYACFYHGGTFYEEFAGQKQKTIESYYKKYLKQEGIPEEI
jgi:hypothetical protein